MIDCLNLLVVVFYRVFCSISWYLLSLYFLYSSFISSL
ncbi:putative membrane protein [Escherichia coli 8-415-05_S4_C1]|nr:putative membrane protein [Escherichia coli 8-415-05_S4_C2]KEJ20122.1 putative membrane protein [Escherichia coli 8-415-05_S4_C1]KEJ22725.1 putative membrane protein [Escherichia coli 8-415-05_S4_C3]KEN28485.1 putative membrane protein [Escherichia coli 8-415-05_S3_C3]KEN33494.1 putative membrane protein [Escherichia coli 8-415-05_S3_C1]KEN80011.1 putative membrane protein [Escherichia coli 8-415-05_S3_C2]